MTIPLALQRNPQAIEIEQLAYQSARPPVLSCTGGYVVAPSHWR